MHQHHYHQGMHLAPTDKHEKFHACQLTYLKQLMEHLHNAMCHIKSKGGNGELEACIEEAMEDAHLCRCLVLLEDQVEDKCKEIAGGKHVSHNPGPYGHR